MLQQYLLSRIHDIRDVTHRPTDGLLPTSQSHVAETMLEGITYYLLIILLRENDAVGCFRRDIITVYGLLRYTQQIHYVLSAHVHASRRKEAVSMHWECYYV